MPLQTSCHSASAVCLLLLLHIGVTAPSIAHNLRKWGVVSFTHVSFPTAQLLWSTKPQKIAFLLQYTVNSTWAMPLHCLGDITCYYIRILTLSDKKESHFPGKTDVGTQKQLSKCSVLTFETVCYELSVPSRNAIVCVSQRKKIRPTYFSTDAKYMRTFSHRTPDIYITNLSTLLLSLKLLQIFFIHE